MEKEENRAVDVRWAIFVADFISLDICCWDTHRTISIIVDMMLIPDFICVF